MKTLEDELNLIHLVHEPRWLLTGSCIGGNDKTESNCKTKAFLNL